MSHDWSTGFALWFEVEDGIVGVTAEGEVHALYDIRIGIVTDALESSTDTWELL